MNIDVTALTTSLVATGTQVGLKILGAIAIWIVGKMVINFVLGVLKSSMQRQHVDSTITSYLNTSVFVALRIALAIGVLGFLGVETSSFAALLAAAGVAIGMAWSGLLANFAAGVFLVLLRPFKTKDFISAGGVTGTVTAVGLFATTIDTPDGVVTIVGNGKILADTIQNFSHNPFRRVELVAQLPHGVDPQEAILLLREGMSKIPNVAAEPKPECDILTFSGSGPVLTVRPYTNNQTYWQVYFDTNQMIARVFAQAGYPIPAERQVQING